MALQHVGEWVEIDQANNVVLFCKTGDEFLFVLSDSTFEVVGDSCVE